MIRGRTSILVLGVCIGLLFFGNVIAEEASTVASEKSDFHKALTPQGVSTTTIEPRVLPIHQSQPIAEKDERNIDLTSRKAHERKDESRDSGDESASRNEAKGDASASRGASDTTNSREEPGSSSSDDGSRRPKYGEVAAESSGKSTSTKAVAENPLRLSRTNELTIATAKPASNDSRQDGKRDLEDATLQESSDHEGTSDTAESIPIANGKVISAKLTANVMKVPEPKYVNEESSVKREERKTVTVNKEITTVKSIGDFSSSPPSLEEDAERKDKITKSDYKEVASKEKKEKNAASVDSKENIEDHKQEDRDRELTTPRGIQYEDPPETKRDGNDLGTTASEALDLGKADGKGREGTISLINDTYVNYNHVYKPLTEKESKAGSGDPKKEVEVVENVTYQPILRIVAAANGGAKNDSHFSEPNNREQKTDAKDEKRVDSSAINATLASAAGGAEERKSIGEAESQVKLPETTTRSVRLEEHTSPISPEATPNPVPQGRTIGFSGVNEFPSIEMKSTTKADGGSETTSVTQSSRNASSSAEKTDQRPYPYLKSSRQPFQVTTEVSLKSGSGVTEETSAYENTIGKGESGKKFIVTEPSVVIENSIQQQKPDKENVKVSGNSTAKNPPSLIATTAVPIAVSADAEPTNKTFSQKFNGTTHAAVIKGPSGNNASSTKEQEKVIASSEGYDVTGNGITEVSLAQDGKQVKSHSSEATNASTSRSTETSKTVALNADIQTEPEEAMMIRSTLVVTESTIVPVDENAATEMNKSAISTSTAEVKSSTNATVILENSTKSTTTTTNVTLQSSPNADQTSKSSSATLNPDESSIPTTTSVEYEFVSLTEATSSGSNATEKTIERQTMPSTHDSATTNNSTRNVTTTKPENSSELPTTIESGTSASMDRASTVYRASNETTDDAPITQTVPAEQTNRTGFAGNEVTMSVIDFTTVDTAGASGITEDPAESKDSSFDVNITETSAPGATEFPNSGVTTMPSTTNATRGPSTPFATSKPNIFWSTPSFTDSSEEEVTESIQTLSSDEITLLVKIVIEGTLHEVCPRLPDLRKALADVLMNGLDKPVSPKQIVIHQNPCPESANLSPTSTDISLTTILVYVVDEDDKFDATMTKILPSLYKVSLNFPVRIQKFLLMPEADSGNAIAVVVVSSVAFICLVLLAGLLFIMRKRQTRFNYGERCRPVSLDAYSLDSVSAYNSVRRKGAARSSKRSYGNPTFEDSSAIPSHPLNFAGLSSFCNDVNAINEEYAGIPQVSAKIDELPSGAELKNRYANVIPLPETRVPLQKLNNDASTEYINASYVRGPKNATKYYIACQAPMEPTVTDFWRMIWEQQSKVIIMLTDLVENGVEKCTEYIPPSEVTDCHRLYGDFQVTLKKRETKEKYAISTLHLKNLENNTYREVFHIWYLWPVSGVQSDGTGLIAVLLEARALQRGGPGPIVVHCSPGTGRTGTLIALDLGIRQYEITRTVDVPRVVYTIRRDRAGAVQTKEQYAFIYKALNLYATKLAGGVLEST